MREVTLVHVLRAARAAGRFVLRTREEAVAQAVTFAQRHGVRAWLSAHRGDCVPVDAAEGWNPSVDARMRRRRADVSRSLRG
jgi:hypothetical protein